MLNHRNLWRMRKASMFDDLMFPGVLLDHWQMMQWEQIALTGTLFRLKPKGALEIGVYFGGSLSLTSQFAQKIIAIDIEPEVSSRFACPPNVDLRIGASEALIPDALADFRNEGIPLNFVLIDAEHTAHGVKRDIESVLDYVPQEPLIVAIHDSGNRATRQGILSANWAGNPYVQFVDLDFVPGQVIEHLVSEGTVEVWGGLALAFLNSMKREGELKIRQSAKTSIACLHRYCDSSPESGACGSGSHRLSQASTQAGT
jgi:hypothetical protein